VPDLVTVLDAVLEAVLVPDCVIVLDAVFDDV